MPPTYTARVQPVGIKLDDGYRTLITFAADPDVSLWEKTVTPPGIDGGDAVPTTTMWNNVLRTFAPSALRTMTDASMTCAYDPVVFNQILALTNVKTTISVRFPNGARLSFFGYLRVFEPQENSEGSQPEAQVTITPTNTDPTTGSEADPVYGTGT